MVAPTYDEALRRVLVHEGGYTNHPADPGGPTNFGITQADYAEFKGRAVTAAEVRAMPLADAKAIYRRKYWSRMRCDELPAGLDYTIFDYAVNSGLGRAGKVLRRLLGLSDATWAIDQGVLTELARRAPDFKPLIVSVNAERLAFLGRLRTWPLFGPGWARRVAEVKAASLAMAAATTPPPAPQPSAAAPAKAVVPVNTAAQRTSAGAIAATGSLAAQQAHQSGADAPTIVVIVAIALAVAFGVFVFWQWRQKRQQEQ
jgi:lysozyme family protein